MQFQVLPRDVTFIARWAFTDSFPFLNGILSTNSKLQDGLQLQALLKVA